MNRKGSAPENFEMLFIFFATLCVCIGALIFWGVAYGLTDFWTASSIGTGIRDSAQRGYDRTDLSLVMGYIAVHIFIIVGAYFGTSRGHPALVFVAFILTALLAIFAAILSNAYATMTADSGLAGAIALLPMTNYIMSMLPYFEVVWAAFTGIFVYSGMRNGEGF